MTRKWGHRRWNLDTCNRIAHNLSSDLEPSKNDPDLNLRSWHANSSPRFFTIYVSTKQKTDICNRFANRQTHTDHYQMHYICMSTRQMYDNLVKLDTLSWKQYYLTPTLWVVISMEIRERQQRQKPDSAKHEKDIPGTSTNLSIISISIIKPCSTD